MEMVRISRCMFLICTLILVYSADVYLQLNYCLFIYAVYNSPFLVFFGSDENLPMARVIDAISPQGGLLSLLGLLLPTWLANPVRSLRHGLTNIYT